MEQCTLVKKCVDKSDKSDSVEEEVCKEKLNNQKDEQKEDNEKAKEKTKEGKTEQKLCNLETVKIECSEGDEVCSLGPESVAVAKCVEVVKDIDEKGKEKIYNQKDKQKEDDNIAEEPEGGLVAEGRTPGEGTDRVEEVAPTQKNKKCECWMRFFVPRRSDNSRRTATKGFP